MFKNLSDFKNKNKKAFTIAEMTVVLLILSIVMAAILPVATNKRTGGTGGSGTSGSLWKLARNNTDVWFASPSSTQSVLIGTSITPDSSVNSGRLNINIPNSTNRSQIAMMYNNTPVGYIKFKSNNNMGFGPTNPLPTDLSGSNNTAIGENALISLSSGGNNISIGSNSLRSVSTGNYNVAINSNALRNASTSSNNIGIGQKSLYTTTTGGNNIGIGLEALYSNSTGEFNVGIGRNAASKLTSSENTAIGEYALYNNTSGKGNTSLGAFAGYSNNGNNSVFIGYQSGRWNGATGDQNVGVGFQSLAYANGAGNYNVGIGSLALANFTSGNSNVGIGRSAGPSISTGVANVGVGLSSLLNLTTGSYNIGVGAFSCGNITGSYKSCFGYDSGYTVLPQGFTANNNTRETIIGSSLGNIFLHGSKVYVLYNNQSATAAAANAAANSGSELRVAGNIHANAGITTHTSLTTGTTATIGTSASVGTNLTVGTNTYTNYLYTNEIRNRAAPNSNNTIIYGTFYGPWYPSSDKRLKNIEGFANTGLAEVKKLNVYKYTYKNDPKTEKIGLLAQDVEKVIPFGVVKGSDGYLSLAQDNIIYTMFNAIKDLDKLYENLKAKFQDYIVRLNLVENKINNLVKVNSDLTKRINELEKRVNKLEKEYTKLEKKQCQCK